VPQLRDRGAGRRVGEEVSGLRVRG
jgi:hypothetical protein